MEIKIQSISSSLSTALIEFDQHEYLNLKTRFKMNFTLRRYHETDKKIKSKPYWIDIAEFV